jgi:hypothetical protein
MLRKVDNRVKAQAAFAPKLKEWLATVAEYFASARKTPKIPEGETVLPKIPRAPFVEGGSSATL